MKNERFFSLRQAVWIPILLQLISFQFELIHKVKVACQHRIALHRRRVDKSERVKGGVYKKNKTFTHHDVVQIEFSHELAQHHSGKRVTFRIDQLIVDVSISIINTNLLFVCFFFFSRAPHTHERTQIVTFSLYIAEIVKPNHFCQFNLFCFSGFSLICNWKMHSGMEKRKQFLFKISNVNCVRDETGTPSTPCTITHCDFFFTNTQSILLSLSEWFICCKENITWCNSC